MKFIKSAVYVVLCFLMLSCASTSKDNYRLNKGLIFDSKDWGAFIEQPYVMIGQDAASEGTKVSKMYLPGQLFQDVEIKYVYFRKMKSSMTSWTENKKPQVLVIFDESQHTVDESMFGISETQAVVYLQTKSGREKVVKLEDIRIIEQ